MGCFSSSILVCLTDELNLFQFICLPCPSLQSIEEELEKLKNYDPPKVCLLHLCKKYPVICEAVALIKSAPECFCPCPQTLLLVTPLSYWWFGASLPSPLWLSPPCASQCSWLYYCPLTYRAPARIRWRSKLPASRKLAMTCLNWANRDISLTAWSWFLQWFVFNWMFIASHGHIDECLAPPKQVIRPLETYSLHPHAILTASSAEGQEPDSRAAEQVRTTASPFFLPWNDWVYIWCLISSWPRSSAFLDGNLPLPAW